MALDFNEWQGVLRRHENSPYYPDFAVRWTSKSLNFPERLGFFNVGDLGVDSIDFLQRSSLSGFNITNTTLLQVLRFPYLRTVGDASHAGALVITGNTGLVEIDLPGPLTVQGALTITGNTALLALDLTNLVGAASITTTGNGSAVITLPANLPNTLTSFAFGGSSSTGISLHDNAVLTSFAASSLATMTGPLNVFNNTNAGLTTITLAALANATSLNFSGNSHMTTLTISSLVHATGLINVSNAVAFTTLSLAGLLHADGGVNVSGDTLLTTPTLTGLLTAGGLLDFHSSGLVTLTLTPLVTASAGIDAHGCAAFTTLTMSNFLPTNGTAINFNGCALTFSSVNLILARGVASTGFVSGSINTAGGTSAAPTGQGVADKATLIARGITVTTN
jgi:hypothetical protein